MNLINKQQKKTIIKYIIYLKKGHQFYMELLSIYSGKKSFNRIDLRFSAMSIWFSISPRS